MPTGLSLHVGLNTVDSSKYKGEYQPLRNAENDTRFYYELANQNKYSSVNLTGKDATSINLLDCLKDYSNRLVSGDLCFISYSGHGTRVKDLNNDEEDGYDEALVLYDRLFIDDEFQLSWAKFKAGVKIFFINDSCYNGTVSRFIDLNKRAIDVIYSDHVLRGIDSSQASIDFDNNIGYFKSIKLGSLGQKASCSIIHIGACQDNQLADDGSTTETNGKFTSAIKDILVKSSFTGSYRSFFDKIKLKMPPWQTPNWDTEAGKSDLDFENSQLLVF
jgi:hypothetical protein